MKNLVKVSLIVLVLIFSGCATVDRGNFGQFTASHLNSYKNSYDVIDTSKEDIGIPKPPVPVVERFEVVSGGCSGQDCGTLRDGNSKGDRERIEIRKARDTYDGSEFWYTWSIYFPKDYKSIAPAQSTFAQFHGYPGEVYYMFVENKGYYIKKPRFGGTFYGPILDEKELRGKWHTIKLHIKWSSDSKKGFFKVWANNKLKYEEYGKTYYGTQPYFKYGIYRTYMSRYKSDKLWRAQIKLPADAPMEAFKNIPQAIVPAQVVYYSNVRRSDTEEGLNLIK